MLQVINRHSYHYYKTIMPMCPLANMSSSASLCTVSGHLSADVINNLHFSMFIVVCSLHVTRRIMSFI